MSNLDWSDERWVRSYVRETPDWTLLSFDARGLYRELATKVDRAGVLELGRHGARGIASLVRLDLVRTEAALAELVAEGHVVVAGERLTIPEHLKAQTARMSDRLRQQESRALRRALAMGGHDVTDGDAESHGVTDGHEAGPDVTSGPSASRRVTSRQDEKRQDETKQAAAAAVPSSERKTVRLKPQPTSAGADLAAYLLEAIRSHHPDATKLPKDPTGWALEFDVGLRAGVTVARFKAAIDYAHRDPRGTFWRPNIRSAATLREKFDTLEGQMRNRPAAAQGRGLSADDLFSQVGLRVVAGGEGSSS